VAGEACPSAVAAPWVDGRTFWNLYGPTEGSIWATALGGWTPAPGHPEQGPPLGRPIQNVQVYVLDPQGAPVPVDIAGEVYLGGICLARGYLNAPALTAARFVPDPLSAQPGQRLYRTGDRGRWLADGTLDFLGRVDQQVKVRGYRVELGEIEAVLRQHPAVRDAAVAMRADATGEARVVAYLVSDEAVVPSPTEVRAFVKARLPEQMVPVHVVSLPALPLTATGKLDRQALPAPSTDRALEVTYVAPRTPTEEALTDIWAEVLGLPHVGVHDNFFDLGGNSLLLLRAFEQVRTLSTAPLAIVDLFACPTIHLLATHLEGQRDVLAGLADGQERAAARRNSQSARRANRERRQSS
jgi:hypothetical protein